MTCRELFNSLGYPVITGCPTSGRFCQKWGFKKLRHDVAVDLPSLSQVMRDLVVYARTVPLPEVSFLVARLQYAPILHHNAHLPCEAKRQQQALHGCRQDFGSLNFSPKLTEIPLFIEVI